MAKKIGTWLDKVGIERLAQYNDQAADIFYRKGVTFTVYSDAENIERMIPFDIIPRVIDAKEWQQVEAGCKQRINALNMFLDDIYHEQRIMKAGVVPDSYVYASGCYEPWMMNINLEKPVYSHISGIDLIRDEAGKFCVLEDNLRTPSGVSYMLESRNISRMLLPDLYESASVLSIDDYPERLKACLASATDKYDPQIVILTPGRFNSAYYEHAYLAHEMNVPLVHGYDLIVEDSKVYMQAVRGKVPVDIIYRRIDDPYLDPLGFDANSILGVSGLMSAYRAGNVVIVNAPGTGVADDKSLYPFVPDMIEFYLGEKPILPNVQTYQCRKPDELEYVLENLDKLVVKETQGSGGYGMLIGPTSTEQEIEDYRVRLLDNPAGFIAQPTISLSTNPTTVNGGIAPRHIDLRPFILSHGDGSVDIVPGGLTRVAMKEGSLVVNSSQGGGIKDTWVIDLTQEQLDDSDVSKSNSDAYSDNGFAGSAAMRHASYLNVTSYPVEVGYDNTPDAPIILLLSRANHLVWLGRYSERLHYYDAIMKKIVRNELNSSQIHQLINRLGIGANVVIADESNPELYKLAVLRDLESNQIPEVIEAIETNVQEVKGIIGKDTAELYNLIKRLASAGTYRAATLQLQACNAAMEQENQTVTYFWELGRYFEALERTILLDQDFSEISVQFKACVNDLPQNTRWRELIRLTNQLIKSKNFDDYLLLSEEFNALLQQGV
ncbi:circularly permuted type 2 ATP-grasp protein [Psychrobacter proteolyticus]